MRRCQQHSEIYVNVDEGVAVLKCFSCKFTQELGPGATTEDVIEIELKDHRPGRWKRG